MIFINAIWATILLIVSLIALVGSLWVLRVALDWLFGIDCMADITKWFKDRNR